MDLIDIFRAFHPNSEEYTFFSSAAAAAAKLLQSCPTLCDPIDDSPPGSPVPGILQIRTLEWVAISFSNAWKWKVNVKSLLSDSYRPHGLQPTRLLHPWDFPGKSTGVGCHCLLCFSRAHGTFYRIDHILGHKSNLSKFKKIEILSSIFSDHNAMRLDIIYEGKKSKKHKHMEIKQHASK